MDARAELREIIRQATEHLRYCSELGLTHIGEEFQPISDRMRVVPEEELLMTRLDQAVAQLASTEESPAPSFQASTEEAAIVFSPSISLPQPVSTMTTKKEAPATPSLFGEPETTQPEAPPTNETLEDIRRDLGECQRCKLWTTRTKIVFGEGSTQAPLIFVGEAPGADEDATGRPFIGRAGQLLTKMIEAIDLKREDVYIANVLKSRPPGNRNPEADEVRACIPFLFRQIVTIHPKLIVALGNPAMQALLGTKTGITKMRGEFQPYPRLPGIWVMPTFHPAYLLRSPDKKREAWEDLKKIRAFLRGEFQP